MMPVYFGGPYLSPRGVARDLDRGPYPLREGVPLRLWEMDPLESGTPDYIVEDATAHYDEKDHDWTWRSRGGSFTRLSEAPPEHWCHSVDWAAVERQAREDGGAWRASWRPVRPRLPETPLRCSRDEPARGENLHLGGGRFRDWYCPDWLPEGGYSDFFWDPPDTPPRPNAKCPWCNSSFLQGYHDLHPDDRPERPPLEPERRRPDSNR